VAEGHEAVGCGERSGVGSGERLCHSPENNRNFALEIAHFGVF